MPPFSDKALYKTCVRVPNSDTVLLTPSGKPLSLPLSNRLELTEVI